MMCFKTQSVPQTIVSNRCKLEEVKSWYRKELFWKITTAKEEIRMVQNKDRSSNTHTKEKLLEMQKEYEDEITRLRNLNQKKITDVEVIHAQELQIKAVQEEKKWLQKSLLLDSILSDRAEVQVLTEELERCLISSSVQVLDAET